MACISHLTIIDPRTKPSLFLAEQRHEQLIYSILKLNFINMTIEIFNIPTLLTFLPLYIGSWCGLSPHHHLKVHKPYYFTILQENKNQKR